MSNRRFVEISSANRNRNQYPQPAEFEVPFAPPRSLNTNQQIKGYYYSQTGYTGPNGPIGTIYTQTMDVADPVTDGVVEYLWPATGSTGATGIFRTDTSYIATGPSSTIYNVYVNVNGPTGSCLNSPYRTVTDYYVGYQLQAPNAANAAIIQSYTPSSGLMTLQTPLITTPVWNDPVSIVDPSQLDLDNTYGFTGPPWTLTLPGIDACGKKIMSYDQAYNGYYVIDETLSQYTHSTVYSTIVSYDYTTRKATLDQKIPGWTITNQYSIRKSLPTQFLNVSTAVGPTSLPLPTLYNQPNYQLNTSNCIFLGPGANMSDNYYNGQYIYVYPSLVANNQITPLTNIEGSCFYINAYIGNGINACFVNPVNPPNVIRPTQYYPSYQSEPISYPINGDYINIVSFSNDNYNPLMYNGSVVSQNETVAYEISLVNLTLPNITLVTGARIAFYPYVYVEFTNVTAGSSSSKNVIYSNNPNSNRALFLVPITDINDPLRSPFIKLDAGSMTQTVKFKPNDCLRFSVFLPDGTLYQTITSDYYNPSGPNPFCQIDALFGIKRLTGV
jgi:hypothetical protein